MLASWPGGNLRSGWGASLHCSPWPQAAVMPLDHGIITPPTAQQQALKELFPRREMCSIVSSILLCFLIFQKIQLAFNSKLWVLLDIHSQVAN